MYLHKSQLFLHLELISPLHIHEYIHIYQNAHNLHGGNSDIGLTLWLGEGSTEVLAHYLASKKGRSNYKLYLKESLTTTLKLREKFPGIGIKNIHDHESLERLLRQCPEECLGTLLYETGAIATAFLIRNNSFNHFYKRYIPSIAYLGGEKAFKKAFGLSLNDFYYRFEKFLNLPEEEQLDYLSLN